MIQPNFIAGYIAHKSSNDVPQYLLLKRAATTYLPGIWQIVTGKLIPDESATEALVREIKEETGLVCDRIYNVDATSFYEQHKNRVAFSANFCGLVNAKIPVHICGKEHCEYGWFSYNEAVELLAFPAQKMTLAFIHENYILKTPDPVNEVTQR